MAFQPSKTAGPKIWPVSGRRPGIEPVLDHFGNSLITVVQVPAGALAGWPAQLQPDVEFAPEDEAHFFEAPTLLGMQTFDDSSQLNLFWRNDGHTYRYF